MDKLIKALQLIHYLIWIPLGILLLAVIVFLLVANPFAGVMDVLGGAGGGLPAGLSGDSFGPPGGQGFPSEEMIRQFLEQQGSPEGAPPAGGFTPPSQ